MGDAVVLKYNDIVLRDSDLDTLRGPCFLNDQIVGFYFSYLSSSLCKTEADDILLITPSVSFYLANCEDDKVVSEIVESYKLSSKRLVLFAINDSDGLDGGSHWSTLVYDRTKNAFLHYDSMKDVNNGPAEKLYNAVKSYMGPGGGEVSKPQTSSKKHRNKKKSSSVTKPEPAAATPAGLPILKECQTPQQSNGYDCGIYVLAIARAICEHGKKNDLLSAITTHVDDSVEVKMRNEVLDIIHGLRKD